ncbi:hypothetical protein STEG23_025231 [Scotinomys teguina]
MMTPKDMLQWTGKIPRPQHYTKNYRPEEEENVTPRDKNISYLQVSNEDLHEGLNILLSLVKKNHSPKPTYIHVQATCNILTEDALLTDKVKVKEQLVQAEQSLEKIQEEEVRKSVSVTATQSENEEESQFETKAQEVKVKVKEFSFSSSSESDSEEEERLEQEIVDLKMKLKKCKMKERTARASAPSPPPYNSDWTAVGKGRGVCFTLPQQAFPVMEMDDPNNPGQRVRYHQALTIKELKGLKEAVAAYGALTPFTLTMVEFYQVSNLTPDSWQQLARAALTWGGTSKVRSISERKISLKEQWKSSIVNALVFHCLAKKNTSPKKVAIRNAHLKCALMRQVQFRFGVSVR